MINSDNAINNHHSLWNSAQEELYINTAKTEFPKEFNELYDTLLTLGMLNSENMIQEFCNCYREHDGRIMEITGLAYVGI